VGKKLWSGIKKVFHTLGLITNFILLAAFYFVPIGVYALFARLARRDFLDIRDGSRPSFWKPRRPDEPTLERARRQS